MKIKKLMKTILVGAIASLLAASSVSAYTGTVTADILTVRTAPSTDSAAAGYVTWGEVVDITYEPSDSWYEIYLNDGCYYVSSEFVSRGGSAGYGSQAVSYGQETYYENGSVEYDYDYDNYGYDNGVAAEESYSNTTYLGNFTLTAYCGCAACCGRAGATTASGTMPQAGRTVAMGGVPFGTRLLINGHEYVVEDRGTSYGMVDIFFNSHSDAIAFGMQSADVYQIN